MINEQQCQQIVVRPTAAVAMCNCASVFLKINVYQIRSSSKHSDAFFRRVGLQLMNQAMFISQSFHIVLALTVMLKM